jgi:hypothetical protein
MFSMADIHAHIGQLADEFATAKRRVETRRASETVVRIEPGLGTVRVLGTGELKAVELNSYRVTHYSGTALARAVLEAVRQAEQRARDSVPE